jgi:[protein-PII] uridylyltransferase
MGLVQRKLKMASPFDELKTSRQTLVSALSGASAPQSFEDEHTEIMDQYFRRTLQESEVAHRLFKEKTSFAFVAVGGYGRKALCLHSDIDIMILFRSKIPNQAKKLAEEALFPLWDLGLDLGYAMRNIKDCCKLSGEDFSVLTSLMDARFICGDSPLYLAMGESLQKKVVSKKKNLFLRWLKDQDKLRMAQFGDASDLLEPHLKEGIGGLRDYHHMLWLARAFFDTRLPRDLEFRGKLSHKEFHELSEAIAFISFVRNHLHHETGRKNDRLNFEYQERVARKLGFRSHKGVLAVETFSAQLHRAMSTVKALHRAFLTMVHPRIKTPQCGPEVYRLPKGLSMHQGEIVFDAPTSILSDPFLLMKVFEEAGRLKVPLSLETRRLVREFEYLVDDDFRKSSTAVRGFLNILHFPQAFSTLEQMFETGHLSAFIPEFGRVRDRVQFDAYHIYPVGRHSLESVRFLKGLGREKDLLLLDIFSDLSNPEPVILAGLFHDIGKNGRHHAQRGATITKKILQRFSYNEKDADTVYFLIRNHLLLIETATQRDLNDEKVVIQCARLIGTLERLKMLYLLTWADSKATGPRAWSSWIANLVQELFFKVLHTLENGELATPNASRKVTKTLSKVRRILEGGISAKDMDLFFEVMSPRYLLETAPQDIASHVRLYLSLEGSHEKLPENAFALEAKEDETRDCWEATLLGKDKPGLFSNIAGALALNNINILSARIYTWHDGTALDIFHVTNPLDLIHSDETWHKVRKDIEYANSEDEWLVHRLEQKVKTAYAIGANEIHRPPRVSVKNDASDFFTLIEVVADDRLGLLYNITHSLTELGLDIRIAKIATKGDQIADVFYVRDIDGQKVVDEQQVKAIEETLLLQLGEGS